MKTDWEGFHLAAWAFGFLCFIQTWVMHVGIYYITAIEPGSDLHLEIARDFYGMSPPSWFVLLCTLMAIWFLIGLVGSAKTSEPRYVQIIWAVLFATAALNVAQVLAFNRIYEEETKATLIDLERYFAEGIDDPYYRAEMSRQIDNLRQVTGQRPNPPE